MRIGKKGFTLVEVIVSLAIMTIVAGSVGAFIVAGNNSYLRGNKELTLQEEAQLADPETLMRYIRVFSELSGQLRYATQHSSGSGWQYRQGCSRQ